MLKTVGTALTIYGLIRHAALSLWVHPAEAVLGRSHSLRLVYSSGEVFDESDLTTIVGEIA
jgi:hypothetical protein